MDRTCASAALARGLFFKTRLSGPFRQLGFHIGKGDAARVQHHKQAVDKVGGLGDQPLTILGYRSKYRLDRLLTELLGTMSDAAVEQLARIGQVGARLGAV